MEEIFIDLYDAYANSVSGAERLYDLSDWNKKRSKNMSLRQILEDWKELKKALLQQMFV